MCKFCPWRLSHVIQDYHKNIWGKIQVVAEGRSQNSKTRALFDDHPTVYYWPSLVTLLPDELQLASTYRLLSNQRSVLFPVWSFWAILSWNTFPCLPLLYASHLWPLCLVTDNYCWCSSQTIYPTRDKKIIYKRRAKETLILLVTIQRFSLNRGFCNFWNSTLSHSSARKSTKQHRSATQDVSKRAEINGE